MFDNDQLSFAANTLHLLTTLTVFSLGILVSIAQFKLFRVPRFFAFFLYVWQTVACLIFFDYSIATVSDSVYYYLGLFDGNQTILWGTNAIKNFTVFLVDTLQLSYLGAFLFFNLISFIGALGLFSALCSVLKPSTQKISWIAVLIILLPGLSIWTSSIGKDAIIFFSSGIICWAIIAPHKRLIFIAIGTLFMFVARPHMGTILFISIFGSILLFASQTGPKKLKYVLPAMLIIPVLFMQSIEFIGLKNLNFLSLVDYIESRQTANLQGTLSYDLTEASIFTIFFNYLYGPWFTDMPLSLNSNAIFSIIIRLENLILLLLSLSFLFLKLKGRKSSLPFTALLFCTIYSLTSLTLLSLTTSNLGIAMRHKWMILPFLLLIFCSYCRQERGMKVRG